MKFLRRKNPDEGIEDATEIPQIQDAANILKEGTKIPGKENIPVADKF